MSLQQHTGAQLHGYNGPMFTHRLVTLHKLWCSFNLNGTVLWKIVKSIGAFREMYRPKTTDNYSWFWALKFHVNGGFGQIIVAIPWSTDDNLLEGYKSDRLCAVYTWGIVNDAVVDDILQQLVTNTENYMKQNALPIS